MTYCSGCEKRHDSANCPYRGGGYYLTNNCTYCGAPMLGAHYHEESNSE